MNVLILSQYYYPEVGATQNRMASLAKAFVRAGDTVTVVTEVPNHPQGIIGEAYQDRWTYRERRGGYDIIRVYVMASPKKTFTRRLAFYLSFALMGVVGGWRVKDKPDLVLATSPPFFVGFSGWLLSRLRRSRLVLDIRDLWPAAAVELGLVQSPWLIGLARRMEGFLYRKASLISSATQSFLPAIESHRNAAPTVWVPNGTEPHHFSPDKLDSSLREQLGFQGKFVVSFAGNLGLAQDLDTILAAARLLSSDQRVLFFFIGAGPMERNFRRKVKQAGLKNICFHPQVPVKSVPAYLLASDALLVTLADLPLFRCFVPSRLYDFLSCGVPVISNVQGEARQVLEASGGGIPIAGADPEALKEAVEQLIQAGPQRRREMGQRGRQFVTARYDRSRIADDFVERLHRLHREAAG